MSDAADENSGDERSTIREADEDDGHGLPTPAEDSGYGLAEEKGFGASGEDSKFEGSEGTFDLTHEAEPESKDSGQDELLLDASRLADADEPVASQGGRRARMLGASAQDGGEKAAEPAAPAPAAPAASAGGAAASGSTLFERMANLSRQTPESEDEDDDDDEDSGGAMRIPRFLGRQNNQ